MPRNRACRNFLTLWVFVLWLWSGGALALEAITNKPSITCAAALIIAEKCMALGKSKGAHMSIVVADQSGLPLVLLRDDQASEQFADGAKSKAWTAVNLKDSTSNLLKQVKDGKGDNQMLPYAAKSLLLMGGEPLKIGDTVVGAIGAAGSPNGLVDAAVAEHGRLIFEEMLKK